MTNATNAWLAGSALPPLQARWAEALLGGAVPGEPKATCGSCAMCAPNEAATSTDIGFFSPITKCCTYLPELANFLVGGVVSDDAPDAAAGRATVERRIAARAGVTPLGLARTKVYTLLYGHGHRGFGRAKSMECPHHLPDGRCGVWRHRESTCATWFCKHERGEVGKEFWRRLHDLLSATESVLARHCVLSLGVGARAMERLFPPRALGATTVLDASELDGEVEPRAYAESWGDFAGRELEFYRRSAGIVAELAWNDVLRIGGLELELLARLTTAAHERLLSPAMPERPRHRRLKLISVGKETAELETYSPLDPLRVPRKLLDVLPRFDGRPLGETLAAIEKEDGLKLSPGLARKLVDFGILDAGA